MEVDNSISSPIDFEDPFFGVVDQQIFQDMFEGDIGPWSGLTYPYYVQQDDENQPLPPKPFWDDACERLILTGRSKPLIVNTDLEDDHWLFRVNNFGDAVHNDCRRAFPNNDVYDAYDWKPIYILPKFFLFAQRYYEINRYHPAARRIQRAFNPPDENMFWYLVRLHPEFAKLIVADIQRYRVIEIKSILRQVDMNNQILREHWEPQPAGAEIVNFGLVRPVADVQTRYRIRLQQIDYEEVQKATDSVLGAENQIGHNAFNEQCYSITRIPDMMNYCHYMSLYLWAYTNFNTEEARYNYLVTNLSGTMLMEYIRYVLRRYRENIVPQENQQAAFLIPGEVPPTNLAVLVGVQFKIGDMILDRFGEEVEVPMMQQMYFPNLENDDDDAQSKMIINRMWKRMADTIMVWLNGYNNDENNVVMQQSIDQRIKILDPSDLPPHTEARTSGLIWIKLNRIDFHPLNVTGNIANFPLAFSMIPYPEVEKMLKYRPLHYIGFCTAEVFYLAANQYPKIVNNYEKLRIEFLQFLSKQPVDDMELWSKGNIKHLVSKLEFEGITSYLVCFESGRVWCRGVLQVDFDLFTCYFERSKDIRNIIHKLTNQIPNTVVIGYIGNHVFIIDPKKFQLIGPIARYMQDVQKTIEDKKKAIDNGEAEDFDDYSYKWNPRVPLTEKQEKKLKEKVSLFTEMAFDIETYSDKNNKQVPYILSLYQFYPTQSIKTWVKDQDGCTDVCDSFRNYLFEQYVFPYRHMKDQIGHSKKSKHPDLQTIRIWSFYGTKFDLHLLNCPEFITAATWIGNPSEYKGFKYENLIFSDFFLFFPMSLNKLGLSWLGRGKLDHADFDKINEDTWSDYCRPQDIKYCEGDCILLGDVILEFFKATREILKFEECPEVSFGVFHEFAMTAPAFAMKLFVTCFNKWPIWSQEPEALVAVREAYFGGFTQAFVRNPKFDRESHSPEYYPEDPKLFDIFEDMINVEFDKNHQESPIYRIYAYDILSSYPAAMRAHVPTRYMRSVQLTHIMNYVDLPRCNKGVVRLLKIKWKVHKRYLISHLGIRIKGGVFYVRDTTEDHEFSWHWENEVQPFIHRFEILIVEEFQEWSTKPLFGQFVEEIYAKRVKAKADQKPALVDYYKLLMNSVYGKTGQKKHDITIWGNFWRIQQLFDRDDTKEIKSMKQLKGDTVLVRLNQKENGKASCGDLVNLASFITAEGRANLMRGIDAIGDDRSIMYVDTDSIFTTRRLPARFISDHELGKFKLENNITDATFAGPKAYNYTNLKGKITRKIKGNRASAFDGLHWSPHEFKLKMKPQMQMVRSQAGDIHKKILNKVCIFSGMKRRWPSKDNAYEGAPLHERGDNWTRSDLLINRAEAEQALKNHEDLVMKKPATQSYTKIIMSAKRFRKFGEKFKTDPEVMYPEYDWENPITDEEIVEEYRVKIHEMKRWFEEQRLTIQIDEAYVRKFASQIFSKWSISDSIIDKLIETL